MRDTDKLIRNVLKVIVGPSYTFKCPRYIKRNELTKRGSNTFTDFKFINAPIDLKTAVIDVFTESMAASDQLTLFGPVTRHDIF